MRVDSSAVQQRREKVVQWGGYRLKKKKLNIRSWTTE